MSFKVNYQRLVNLSFIWSSLFIYGDSTFKVVGEGISSILVVYGAYIFEKDRIHDDIRCC
jgi:hypothetical protein